MECQISYSDSLIEQVTLEAMDIYAMQMCKYMEENFNEQQKTINGLELKALHKAMKKQFKMDSDNIL